MSLDETKSTESPCGCSSSGCGTPTRREFIKFAGLGAAAMFTQRVFAGPWDFGTPDGILLDHIIPLDKKLSAEWVASLFARGTPSSWTDWNALRHIGMPVAGIGSGTVYLGGDGRLWCWDLFNVPHEGIVPNKALPRKAYSERDGANYFQPPTMESPWNIGQGLVVHVGGKALRLDHSDFPQVKFTGEYPVGRVDLAAPGQPVSATIEAWSPFIPLSYDDSSLPLAVLEVTLKNGGDTPLEVELEAFLENAGLQRPSAAMVGCSRVTQVAPITGGALVSGTVTVPEAARRQRNWGSLALAMLAPGAKAQAARGQDGDRSEKAVNELQEMAVRAPFTLPPKGEVKVPVLVAWHFPHVHPTLGDNRRWYSEKFADAAAVAAYAVGKFAELSRLTHLFRETWYGTEEGPNRGTLPHWLLERSLWTLTTITTGGTYRLTGNRIWGWEGSGCCEGTCTHVWHYGQSMGRLFPQAEIDLRERTDFVPGSGMTGEGLIRFRGAYSSANHPCIDGQVGVILRCYREHLNDPSGEFLKRNWASIKKATDFLVRSEASGKKDGNDGIFTQRFENTLDAKWGGEIPWLMGLYLAGLRGAAVMARTVGDAETAKTWEAIVAKGKVAYDGYFDPKLGYHKAKFTEADLEPVHIGIGCHIDMCLADFWLAQVGLPPLGKPEQLRQSMHSLYQYNFMPDMGVYREFCKKDKRKQGRWYALAGEAGLIMTTWPHGGLPPQARSHPERFGYFQECMSGFEHSAAALMVSLAKDEKDPLLLEGLAVCRAVHDRYDAAKRNPYNEVECSDHYARAMASYGVFLAATGFHCDASKGLLRFDPKIRPDDCAMPFVGAGAWGRFAQTRTGTGMKAQLEVRHGAVKVSVLELRPSSATAAATCEVTLAGTRVGCKTTLRDGLLLVALDSPVLLDAGKTLKVFIR